MENNIIYVKTLLLRGRQKKIKIVQDDLRNIGGEFDILVCSAYKNDYIPLKHTVIGALHKMGVSVKKLAVEPEIDCKNFGVWISKETGHAQFKRVCCIELLDYRSVTPLSQEDAVDTLLKKTFSTMKFAMEQAALMGIKMDKIILPVLGAGSQGLELSYIIPPLINQITALLSTYDVSEVTLFEVNPSRAALLKRYLHEALDNKLETDVFISYSTRHADLAYRVAEVLRLHNITYWMAPESIPTSDDYLEAIPNALTNTKMVLLLLSPEAEVSKWVKRELLSAIDADKTVIPCKLFPYDISYNFSFLLGSCQLFPGHFNEEHPEELIKVIEKNKLQS